MDDERAVAPGLVARTVGLAVAPVIAQGLSRFGYGLLLPAMTRDLHWSYFEAGSVNTANAVGYLIGALAAVTIAARWRARPTFIASLVTSVVLLGACAPFSSLAVICVIRCALGVCSGVAFAVGAAMVSSLSASRSEQSVLTPVYMAGVATGIVLSGVAVPVVQGVVGGESDWRQAWLTLAVIGVLLLPLAVRTSRIQVTYRRPGPRAVSAGIPMLIAAYTLFGAGYVGYMTFAIAFFDNQASFGSGRAGWVWIILGLSGVAGLVLRATTVRRRSFAWSAPTVVLAAACAALLPAVVSGAVSAIVSTALFGAGFLLAITEIIGLGQRFTAAADWPTTVIQLTIGFAVGQCVGPVFAGAAADSGLGLRGGLMVSGVLTALAALLTALAEARLRTSTLGRRTSQSS